MRPLVAILIWIVLLGGLSSYMNARHIVSAPAALKVETDQGDYRVVVTTSFVAQRDSYAPNTEDDPGNALVLKLNGHEILTLKDSSAAGRPITVDKIKSVLIGPNEFLLEVNPPHKAVQTAGAVRVQLYRFHTELMDRTFWADPGSRLLSTFKIEVEPNTPVGDQNGH